MRKSISRYREDPDWHHYRKRESRDWVREFGLPGYPFGTLRNHALHVLEGQARGYPTTLFHLAGVRRGGRYVTDVNRYSVAVLTLPYSLPDTAVSIASLVQVLHTEPFPPSAGIPVHLPSGRTPRMVKCSVDPTFAELVITERVVRMTADTKCGWRLHGKHMIGWIKEMRPYEKVVALTHAMADILAEFPASSAVWGGSDRRPA
ncbi:hypothetical protein ACFVFQ_21715 [Streptomyces sp. NPDC057743]|uniref:hypothetical protein n=1 Tax=Streptomyces sp. NPDC057743 TaxID=3346236 RepID=UPI0036D0E6CD